MQIHRFGQSAIVARRRTVIPVLIFLLLWGMAAFALHAPHHDEGLGDDVACQICEFGALNSTSIIPVGFPAIPILSSAFSLVGHDLILILPHVRLLDARAPPFIS
ncbi:hypothetical protein [Sedimenticola selenatireducens]|uniref:DUF2946 domain-containing protein n=1 Tax=Sedimenticola selenatireducens TaxID=191960 RepID=A0A558DVY7_9GAMM|nr:hypothetical protein [Sedimenticola selenatireducens]TVO77909.1 hypothetical protein FHP88_03675 [Sedimenticola selenatireducens]TVT65214.1 MAG: hypothetical protein FHK78_06040 [Sedimenticola selenatireducens]